MRQTRWTGAARHAWCRAASAAALASLVATLFMCLGAVASAYDGGGGGDYRGTGHTTAITGAPSFDDGAPRAHGADCPPADRHCTAAAHCVRAVLNPAAPSLPAAAKQVPCPRALPTPGPPVEHSSDRGSPDLHMLQVQRI
ncbi:hypothetical protein ABZ953_15915 [Streptomyces sp. NPDC046465]|uniref:hypothetical protein n=1 Tax=Streptomyces sp. NPDC046465 TaxID=3155810 RepID=UPI0033C3CBFB